MRKQSINIADLKSGTLNDTGKQEYGLDVYTYIKFFSYDDNNAIKVRFYVLLKTDAENFDLLFDITYSISDNKSFIDSAGNTVYKVDSDNVTMYENITTTDSEGVETTVCTPVKRLDDYTRNYIGFSTLIVPSINKDIMNMLGYHANEDGAIDNPVIE